MKPNPRTAILIRPKILASDRGPAAQIFDQTHQPNSLFPADAAGGALAGMAKGSVLVANGPVVAFIAVCAEFECGLIGADIAESVGLNCVVLAQDEKPGLRKTRVVADRDRGRRIAGQDEQRAYVPAIGGAGLYLRRIEPIQN